jgi:hypothetical protein
METEDSLLCSQQPAPVNTLSQMNPVHIITTYPFEINFNIIISSTPRPPKWSHPLRFFCKNFVYNSQFFMRAKRFTIQPSFNYTDIRRTVQIMKLLVM